MKKMKNSKKKERKNNSKKVLISVMGLVAIVALLYFVSNAITKYTGYSVSEKVMDKDNDFKFCLAEKEITLYINTNDAMVTLKKIQLYDYLNSVKILNCQVNNELCLGKGVDGPFPAWIINNNLIESDISLKQLEESSGCKSE